jgi:serine O-acetyltransferase
MTDAPESRIISASLPDWSREAPRRFWDPSRRLLKAIRGHQAAHAGGWSAGLARRWWGVQHRFWSLVTQTEIPPGTAIGGGLQLPHPNGIIIHPATIIGPNCIIFQQVTIGTRPGRPGTARIGGHVDIGAGARILGPVTIGDHARIGANAVVTRDVPAHAVAVGVPAVIRPGEAPPETGFPAGAGHA